MLASRSIRIATIPASPLKDLQPTSPPPSISPEVIQMMDTFSKMGVKPKADTPEQLMKWMSDFMLGWLI
jgi:hypothetical protein